MTDVQLHRLKDQVQGRVHVACDGYHAHTAAQGCLVSNTSADVDAVVVLWLIEELLQLKQGLRKVLTDAERS
jgi:hypothetical protein